MGRTGGTGFYLYTYVRKFYFKKRERGKKYIHASRAVQQVWELRNLCEKWDWVMRIGVHTEAGVKKSKLIKFSCFLFFFLFLPCFQNVRFWSWQQKDTIQMQVHLCVKELFLSSSSLPLLLTCSMWCCISCALKIVCVPWQRRLKGT